MKKLIISLIIIVFPLLCWTGFKPIRVVLPELADVSCLSERVCVEDESQFSNAEAFYKAALTQVETEVGFIQNKPRMVFCTTEDCFAYFGLSKERAVTVGTLGIVIGPRAWKNEFISHELIHHLQHEKLGYLKAWFSVPLWFMEGMAYSLSRDPRERLAEPWQGYRNQFESWYANIDTEETWQSAKQL